MDQTLTFARHFARLVWLLLHETGNVDEQKVTLRALVTLSKEGAVTLALRDWSIFVNDAPLPQALAGATELATQLAGHGILEVHIDAAATPADILGAARIIAGDVMKAEGGRVTVGKIRAMNPQTVGFVHRPDLAAAAAAEPAAPAPAPPAAAPPAAGTPSVTTTADRWMLETPPMGIVTGDEVWSQFSATRAPSGSLEDVLARLDAAGDAGAATTLLDDLVTIAETASREGRATQVAEVLHGVIVREGNVPDGDLKRAYVMAIRRLARPPLLKAVANLLPRKRDKADDYMLVLTRTGEDGADALIDQLTHATGAEDRRVFYDALIHLKAAAVPALIHMLGDERWFVARNAADLLGEMQATEADAPLIDLLRHRDDRVRRAATNALVRVGTPTGLKAVHDSVRDESPQVRVQAVAALASRKDEKTATALVKALDDEENADVQYAILAALGKVATADAVRKLAAAAEPEGRFFRKKPTPYRVAAVQALGEARTPPAMAALQSLAEDREREVKDAAARALAAAAKKA